MDKLQPKCRPLIPGKVGAVPPDPRLKYSEKYKTCMRPSVKKGNSNASSVIDAPRYPIPKGCLSKNLNFQHKYVHN